MSTTIHKGHVQLADEQRGATLVLEPGSVKLEIASSGDILNTPESLELIRFQSNTGYFTLINMFRRNHNMKLGVGGLSTYTGGLAFESAHFQEREEIYSQTWSMHVDDTAKILHVNGVLQQMIFTDGGEPIMNYRVASPLPTLLECPSACITVSLGQHIRTSGNAIDGPKFELSYPADITFREEVDIDVALKNMHRIRQLFSLVMGRVLPISTASMRLTSNENPHEIGIHGLLTNNSFEKPFNPILTTITAESLATMLDRWLSNYHELEDAIRLHMGGLEQRRLPTELRFQIFIQALEALHRRTTSSSSDPIDIAPIRIILREHGIPNGVIDRVAGVLAHAHEPGLRQRLRQYWDLFSTELAALRPDEMRSTFIGRVVATRNYYAHRTDRNDQVLRGSDLWDATEVVKALSHLALLREIGVDITGVGAMMLQQRFAEFAIN